MPKHEEGTGAKYLREHYNEVAAKYPDEWVAVNATGVIAHDKDPAKIASANAKDVIFARILPPGARLG
jgi:hypothetical protein